MAGASAEALRGEPCPWDPPCAYDALVREQGRIASGLPVPRPMVLRAEAAGRDLLVELTLFGFACDWMPAAAEALSAALAHGIAPPVRRAGAAPVVTTRAALAAHRPGAPMAAPDTPGLTLTTRRVETAEGLPVPADATAVELEFVTPASLRGGADLRHGLAGFVGALANRVFGMARWQDAGVEADRRALLAAADRIAVDTTALTHTTWRRGSAKQDRWLPMEGDHGPVLLQGPLHPLLPLLTIGTALHAGARTTFGQGAYRMRVVG
ncbi:hypothetical protein HL658_13420 [Azospirillum sp. RWY-5-1]|nr:hypothetical protein [Azospirillum oleiclasticum]